MSRRGRRNLPDVGLIVCVERSENGRRRVCQIVSVQGFDGQKYLVSQED